MSRTNERCHWLYRYKGGTLDPVRCSLEHGHEGEHTFAAGIFKFSGQWFEPASLPERGNWCIVVCLECGSELVRFNHRVFVFDQACYKHNCQ
jgi:hypothetical protein